MTMKDPKRYNTKVQVYYPSGCARGRRPRLTRGTTASWRASSSAFLRAGRGGESV